MATLAEADALMANWAKDPTFDLTPAPEGFEAYAEILTKFESGMKHYWALKHQVTLEIKAKNIGCPDNTKLAEYVLGLERRIESLEAELWSMKGS